MITLYLIRHGETEWNKSGRYQGSTDVALSAMGVAQAEKVASYFKDIPLDGVITSPLKRARITAEGIAKSHPDQLRLPHGESFRDCQVRTMAFMKELLSRGDHKSYAIVSHGAALRTVICAMIDIPLARSWNMGLSNASVTEIRHFVGENNMMDMNMLFSLNQTSHLADTATSHLLK